MPDSTGCRTGATARFDKAMYFEVVVFSTKELLPSLHWSHPWATVHQLQVELLEGFRRRWRQQRLGGGGGGAWH
jgi:hypothetical protein